MNEQTNPYAPPKAAVADITSAEQPPRPPEVTKAVQLLWAAVAVSLVSGIINAYQTQAAGLPISIAFLAVGWVVGLAIAWIILSSIGKGKNWARILQLVLFLLGLLGMLMVFFMPQPVSAIIWGLYAVQLGLNVWGLVLLFSGRGNEWFREMKEWL